MEDGLSLQIIKQKKKILMEVGLSRLKNQTLTLTHLGMRKMPKGQRVTIIAVKTMKSQMQKALTYNQKRTQKKKGLIGMKWTEGQLSRKSEQRK